MPKRDAPYCNSLCTAAAHVLETVVMRKEKREHADLKYKQKHEWMGV
jgi:hypothetical protein